MNEKRYTIEELCEVTGFPRRTIRYYIQEGLLKPPAGRGRGGFYYDSHVNKLLQIHSLQDRGMKLAGIREVLRKGGKPERPCERDVLIRYTVSEGVEIHVSREIEEKKRKQIAEAVRVAKRILEGGNSDE